jgi:hypothetical protein
VARRAPSARWRGRDEDLDAHVVGAGVDVGPHPAALADSLARATMARNDRVSVRRERIVVGSSDRSAAAGRRHARYWLPFTPRGLWFWHRVQPGAGTRRSSCPITSGLRTSAWASTCQSRDSLTWTTGALAAKANLAHQSTPGSAASAGCDSPRSWDARGSRSGRDQVAQHSRYGTTGCTSRLRRKRKSC